MILWIYKNSFCSPQDNVGVCRRFKSSKDVDAYLSFFVASCQSTKLFQYRAFVGNDDVEFSEVDNIVFMDEPIGLSVSAKRIKEINLWDVGVAYNKHIAQIDAHRKRAREQAQKQAKEAHERSIASGEPTSK